MRQNWECKIIGSKATVFHRIHRVTSSAFPGSSVYFACDKEYISDLQSRDITDEAIQYGSLRGIDKAFRPYILYGDRNKYTLIVGLFTPKDLNDIESPNIMAINMGLHILENFMKQMETISLTYRPSAIIITTVNSVDFIWDTVISCSLSL